jgi:hypothetical protein
MEETGNSWKSYFKQELLKHSVSCTGQNIRKILYWHLFMFVCLANRAKRQMPNETLFKPIGGHGLVMCEPNDMEC